MNNIQRIKAEWKREARKAFWSNLYYNGIKPAVLAIVTVFVAWLMCTLFILALG